MARALILLIVTIVSVEYCFATPEYEKNTLLDMFTQLLDVEIKKNDVFTSRTDQSNESSIERFIKMHDMTFNLPIIGSSVTLGARNLDSGELDVKVKYSDGKEVEGRQKIKKVKKMKKYFVPIAILLVIKAMILIPLALGLIGFKTWNAIQLSFISFVVSVGLAVWKFCTKISHDHPPLVLYGNTLDYDRTDLGQQLAYNSYAVK